jgi:hypothetical protein
LYKKTLVPEAGLEPAQSQAPPDFESGASAYSTTPALLLFFFKSLANNINPCQQTTWKKGAEEATLFGTSSLLEGQKRGGISLPRVNKCPSSQKK